MEPSSRVITALTRLKEPFLEIPDTALSLADATQISGLDAQLCDLLLAALVEGRFLMRGPDGAYRRRAALYDDPISYA